MNRQLAQSLCTQLHFTGPAACEVHEPHQSSIRLEGSLEIKKVTVFRFSAAKQTQLSTQGRPHLFLSLGHCIAAVPRM